MAVLSNSSLSVEEFILRTSGGKLKSSLLYLYSHFNKIIPTIISVVKELSHEQNKIFFFCCSYILGTRMLSVAKAHRK